MKKIYGVSFDPDSQSAELIRTYDAKGKQYSQQTGNEIKRSDFDSCYPWCDIKECNILANGTVVYEGEKDFWRQNNTFIEIPAFYFKRTVTENQEEWLISGYPHEGFEIEPWFLDENGCILERRYIAKYECCSFESGFVSVTGQIPLRYLSIDEFKELFAAWAMEIMTSQYAIGSEIRDEVRKNLTRYHQRLGVENENELPPRIKKALQAHKKTKHNGENQLNSKLVLYSNSEVDKPLERLRKQHRKRHRLLI